MNNWKAMFLTEVICHLISWFHASPSWLKLLKSAMMLSFYNMEAFWIQLEQTWYICWSPVIYKTLCLTVLEIHGWRRQTNETYMKHNMYTLLKLPPRLSLGLSMLVVLKKAGGGGWGVSHLSGEKISTTLNLLKHNFKRKMIEKNICCQEFYTLLLTRQ